MSRPLNVNGATGVLQVRSLLNFCRRLRNWYLSDACSGPAPTHHLPGSVRPRYAGIESKGLKGRHNRAAKLGRSLCVNPSGLMLLRSRRFRGMTRLLILSFNGKPQALLLDFAYSCGSPLNEND